MLPTTLCMEESDCWWMSCVCLLSLTLLSRLSSVSVVFDFNDSLNDVVPVSPIPLPIDEEKWKEWIVDECLLCVFFLLPSHLRFRTVSVVFVLSDSLNDIVPVSPMSLPVYVMINEEEWIVDGCILCVFFLLPSRVRSSAVIVVFDFNDSLSDVVPVSPMSLPIDVKRNEEEWIVDGCLLCLLPFAFTTQIECSDCCVWFQRFTQWCCTSFSNLVVCCSKREMKEWFVDLCLLHVFFPFVFTFQIESSECCAWLQWFTYWCYSCVSNAIFH